MEEFQCTFQEQKEVKDELNHGATPWEALYEWDLLEIDEFEII